MMYRIRKGKGKGTQDEGRLHNTLVTRIEAVKPPNIRIIQNPKESIKLDERSYFISIATCCSGVNDIGCIMRS